MAFGEGMAIHLITGGAGFVGSNIARLLLERGEKVRIIDIWKPEGLDSRIEFFEFDILEREKLRAACKGVDYIHHNAALVPLTKAGKDFNHVNYQGTKNVLEIAKEENVKFISHMSSSAIFGAPDDMPIQRDTGLKPIEIYGRSKCEADMLIQKEIISGGAVATIRPRTIVGNERLGIFEILFDWIKDGANIYLIGRGDNLFQFVHIDDLCEVSIQVCIQEKPGLYNVGAKTFRTLREDLSSLIEHAGSKSKIKTLPIWLAITILRFLDLITLSPLAPWHYLTYHKPFYFDVAHVEKELGWSAKYSNEQLLKSSYDWFILNENQINKDPAAKSMHRKAVKQGVLKMLKFLS